MAHERSTEFTHKQNPNQKNYDWNYYNALMPRITGDVLDIGSGAGMFVREYAKKEDVKSVICLDKYDDNEFYEQEKATRITWNCDNGWVSNLGKDKFDTIVSTEFIEHITREQLEPLIESFKPLMHDESVFVGSTPNKVQPTTNPYHLYEYTLDELKGILEKHFSYVKIWDCGDYCTVWVCKK